MTSKITKAEKSDAALITEIGRKAFIESHGHSASQVDVDAYLDLFFTEKAFELELADSKNIYYIINYDGKMAGFSKILLNNPQNLAKSLKLAKLERIYLLQEFYGLNLGLALLDFNIKVCKEHEQQGMWLYVWKENPRAIKFYQNNGFRITGEGLYKLSDSHYNPNYEMQLDF